MAPLVRAGKLAGLLLQYPAAFRLSDENAERLRRTLALFGEVPRVVELRHRSWSDRAAETRALLEEAGASWAVIDEPKFATSVRQPFEPAGELFYLRLHGRNAEKWWRHAESWERYDYLYSPEEISALAGRLRQVGARFPGPVHALFNNHARGQAVANALMLKREMGQEIAAALPAEVVEAFPALRGCGPVEPNLLGGAER